MSIYEKELRFKAGQFIGYIGKRSIYGKVVFIGDFMIKVQIKKNYECFGCVVIYYKPTKMKYKFITIEINNKEMQDYLQELWDRMNKELIRKISKYIIKINI